MQCMQYSCSNAWLLGIGMSDGLLGPVRRTKVVLHRRRRILVFLIRSLTKEQLPIFEVPSFPAARFLISVNIHYMVLRSRRWSGASHVMSHPIATYRLKRGRLTHPLISQKHLLQRREVLIRHFSSPLVVEIVRQTYTTPV